ncbi:hypothetical protein ASPVEDRAFT_31337 [Aspergillus versicolor CBS 583.65]|uniref:FAD-binding domain-containing protein n=1 Tax=Aspergillus versicolor CBS 583.65 TaxID=1036611 RepID=A0A1L9PTS6_ASPVE|nr:uncharacterized protein ASPVEDRAFT_31337 [Aspergillus versicolor CBS 583.65]OJJ04911.1 hypothetical protein ASPVEDRAFT_31337 [Aspergillus versicolor CBS 583.65]
MASPRIAIVGGGPAGLTLGLLLHKHNISFTIYERRSKPTPSDLAKPSGSLDLHDESGLAALKECGIYEDFLKLTGECSKAQKVADKDGIIIYADKGELSERPEISRHALTSLITENLPAESIKYEHKLFAVSSSTNANSDTEVELDFGAQGKETFSLVIGADGAWSRVRSTLTDTKPYYTGTQVIAATIPNITKTYPHLSSLVGQGSFSALAYRHGIMSQRGPGDSARIYILLSLPEQEDYAKSSGWESADFKSAKNQLLTDTKLLGLFGEKIKELVSVACDEEAKIASSSSTTSTNANTNTDPDSISTWNPSTSTSTYNGSPTEPKSNPIPMKPLYTLPPYTSFVHDPTASTTAIGDAAHLMPPWAGEGVNLAMWDSLLLSHAIVKALEQIQSQSQDQDTSFRTAFDPLLSAFETEMFMRAGEKAEETVGNGQMLFGEDGAKAFKEFFESIYGPWSGDA